jgi:CHAD domain-containing protein
VGGSGGEPGRVPWQTWRLSFDVPTRCYVVAAEGDAPRLAAGLADRVREASPTLDADVGEREVTTRVVLDTADRRLRAARMDLAIETGGTGEGRAMFVLGGPAGGARELRVVCSRRRRRYLAAELPGGGLAERLAGIVGVRALLPLVELRREEVPVRVLDREAKTVVRLVVADLWALPKGSPEPLRLRGRVEVTGVLGYRRQFAQVDGVVRGAPDLATGTTTVVDDAITAVGGSPGGLSCQVKVPVDRDEPAGTAARRVLRGLADVVEAQVPGTLDDLDSEFLHDLRIAVRRSRSVLRQMKRAFDPVARREQADSLRWIQTVTGPMRDLDVQLLEWDELVALVPEDRRVALGPAHALLVEQRNAALRTMKATLRSAEYRRHWTAWRLFLAVDPGGSGGRGGTDAAPPIRKLARRRVTALSERIVREGRALTAASPAEALHDIRKRGKELRFVFELFGPSLWPASEVKPRVTALKALQDVLGRFHDRHVQVDRLRALAPELANRPGGAAALLAMGSLIDRLEADQRKAQAGVADRIEAFARLHLRDLA